MMEILIIVGTLLLIGLSVKERKNVRKINSIKINEHNLFISNNRYKPQSEIFSNLDCMLREKGLSFNINQEAYKNE